MANTTVEKIKVDELSRYGFKVGQEYLNYSKQLKESDKVYVVPGAELEVELYVADSGKRYLNKVLNAVKTKVNPVTTSKVKGSVDVVPASAIAKEAHSELRYKVSKVAADAPMTRQDWDSKDRRISRQGCIQAAVQAVASFSTPEDHFDNAVLLANQMLEFVNEVK